MRTILGLAVVLVTLVPSQSAGDVEPGDTWWCYSTAYVSGCSRAEIDCDREREDMATDASQCFEQPKAATFGWFNVMQDRRITAVVATMRDCKALRKVILKSPDDYRAVSACRIVGRIKRPPLPKPGPLKRDAVPKGKGWWCYRGSGEDGSYGDCNRDREECAQTAGENPCVSVPQAFAFSIDDGAVIVPTLKECKTARLNYLDPPSPPFPSACTAVR